MLKPSARTLDKSGIVFLQQKDSLPVNAHLIRELHLSANSYSDSCAWFELLLKGSRIAEACGGNLIKLLNREDHGTQACDAIQLAVYQVEKPHDADHAFRWTTDRKLRWDDFQGMRRNGAGERVAAETSCGISVETSLATATAQARVYVFNTFDKNQSWVAPADRCDAVLGHEQGHWDLCELYTRKMQARFDALSIRGSRLHEVVDRVYNQVESEYLKRQQAYERDTHHGLDHDAQKRWAQMIAAELAQV